MLGPEYRSSLANMDSYNLPILIVFIYNVQTPEVRKDVGDILLSDEQSHTGLEFRRI